MNVINIGPTDNQKEFFGDPKCLPRVIGTFSVRKYSFNSRCTKNKLGKNGPHHKSLDIFGVEKRLEGSLFKKIQGSDRMKQQLPPIEKEDIRIYSKTEVNRDPAVQERIHTTGNAQGLLNRKSSLALRIRNQLEKMYSIDIIRHKEPLFKISSIKPMNKSVDLNRKTSFWEFKQPEKRRYNRIKSFDLGTQDQQISQMQQKITEISKMQNELKGKINELKYTHNIKLKSMRKLKNSKAKKNPHKSYLHEYNPELLPVFKDQLDDIEVNLAEESSKLNIKRGNFRITNEGSISPWH